MQIALFLFFDCFWMQKLILPISQIRFAKTCGFDTMSSLRGSNSGSNFSSELLMAGSEWLVKVKLCSLPFWTGSRFLNWGVIVFLNKKVLLLLWLSSVMFEECCDDSLFFAVAELQTPSGVIEEDLNSLLLSHFLWTAGISRSGISWSGGTVVSGVFWWNTEVFTYLD